MEKQGVMLRRFGRLTIVEVIRQRGQPTRCRCACDCGGEKVTQLVEVKRGRTTSCGCVQRERCIAANTRHGATGSAEYAIWISMRQRCLNPSNPAYPDYGGRGIYIYAGWDDFATFLADVGPRLRGTSLDREDNDGPYAPWNCRWATRAMQARNRRNTRRITFNGETHVLTDWAIRFGIDPQTLSDRLAGGWPLEAAMQPRLPQLTDDEKRQRKNAQSAVQYAVRTGRLLVPTSCEGCTQSKPLEGHHHLGYAREHVLRVRWLCRACHEGEEQPWVR